MAVGLVVGPIAFGLAGEPTSAPEPKDDPRLHVLENFFASRHCPVRKFAADFLAAADQNRLDWRLLPSISFVETGGGKKAGDGNNLFGWNSGKHRFSSAKAAIYTIADKLGQSKLYKNKDTSGILQTYNKHPEWRERVKRVMRAIGTAEIPTTVAALN